MSYGFDENRLRTIRDLVAILRAFAKRDYDHANEVQAPYEGDLERGLELTKELVELTSGTLSTAAQANLPPREILLHYVASVPGELKPTCQRAADLILAVHEQTEAAREDLVIQDNDEWNRFHKALLNLETWLTRQIARRLGVTEDRIYDAVAKRLAAE